MAEDIRARVLSMIAEVAGRDPHSIDPDHDLIMDVGLDSLDTVELAMEIEEQFGLAVRDDEMEAARSVADLITLVQRLAGEVAA